jgi:hypothetical protein
MRQLFILLALVFAGRDDRRDLGHQPSTRWLDDSNAPRSKCGLDWACALK